MAQEKDSFLVKLDELDARYGEIDSQLADPEIASNIDKVIPLSKEQAKIRPMVLKYREYCGACHDGRIAWGLEIFGDGYGGFAAFDFA